MSDTRLPPRLSVSGESVKTHYCQIARCLLQQILSLDDKNLLRTIITIERTYKASSRVSRI